MMRKYFPWYCLPSRELPLEGFFQQQQPSSCFWDQFHNLSPSLYSAAVCTCIHVGNIFLRFYQLPSICSQCYVEFYGMLLLRGYRYLLPCSNLFLITPIPAVE